MRSLRRTLKSRRRQRGGAEALDEVGANSNASNTAPVGEGNASSGLENLFKGGKRRRTRTARRSRRSRKSRGGKRRRSSKSRGGKRRRR